MIPKDDMRNLAPSDVARDLEKHGLPRFFSDVVRGQLRQKGGKLLDLYFERPREFYRLLREHPEDIPFAATILPLHESNCDLFWCYVPPPENLYIQHSIEWPATKYRVLAKSLVEYLDYEALRLCDSEVKPEILREFAVLVGHPDVDRVLRKY